jgi:hypothetical protein
MSRGIAVISDVLQVPIALRNSMLFEGIQAGQLAGLFVHGLMSVIIAPLGE